MARRAVGRATAACSRRCRCSRSSRSSTRRTSPTPSSRARRVRISTRCARPWPTSGEHAEVVPFSAKIEAELAELARRGPHGRFSTSLGLESAGLDRLIRAGYHLLGLQTYFTAGEQEVRAWTIHRGDTAPSRGGRDPHGLRARIHSRRDGRATTNSSRNDGWKGAREKGVVRSEGKEYVVQDGDVMLFRFNV